MDSNPNTHKGERSPVRVANQPTEEEQQHLNNFNSMASKKAHNPTYLDEGNNGPTATEVKSKEIVVISGDQRKAAFTAKYENQVGLMTFSQDDIATAKSCCCCTKILGLMDYPSFQNKPGESVAFSKIHMLANPSSGGGAGKKMRDSIEKQMIKAKIAYRITNSTSAKHFQEVVDAFDFNADEALLVCGGDGSIFMALNTLAARQDRESQAKGGAVMPAYPLIVVPGGTGNDLCSSIGFNHSQAVTFVEKYLWKQPAQFRQIDICRCRIKNENNEWKTYYYSCQAGIGFAGRVDVKAKKMGYMFRLKYRAAALLHVLSAQADSMTITIDGQTVIDKVAVRFMEVNNVPRTGGGFRACPIAQVNDGLLDLIVMSAKSRLQMIKGLQNASKEGYHVFQDNTVYHRGKEIRVVVHSPKAIEMEMDGEDYFCTEAIFDIHPTLVKVPY